MSKTDTPFEDMTLAELHEKAKEQGLTGTSHMKKEELIEALSSGSDAKAPDAKASGKPDEAAGGQYEDMTLAELHEKAKEHGLTGTSHMKKEELVEALSSGTHDGDDAKKSAKGSSSSHDNAERPRDDKGHFEKSGDEKNGDKKDTSKR